MTRYDDQRKYGWRKIHRTCDCGQEVYGNGLAHFRACEPYLEQSGWPMETSMKNAIRENGHGAEIIGAVERELGRIYLERREAGNNKPLRWAEYRDTVWQLVEKVAA
jgi:hypothetical protein